MLVEVMSSVCFSNLIWRTILKKLLQGSYFMSSRRQVPTVHCLAASSSWVLLYTHCSEGYFVGPALLSWRVRPIVVFLFLHEFCECTVVYILLELFRTCCGALAVSSSWIYVLWLGRWVFHGYLLACVRLWSLLYFVVTVPKMLFREVFSLLEVILMSSPVLTA